VRNDPQKAGILTVLVAILVVLQVRLQMSDRGGPSVSRAGVSGKGGKGAAALPNGSSNKGVPLVPGGETGKPVDAATALRAWMDQPTAPIERNLFAINLDRFPQTSARPVEVPVTPKFTFWDELAKSVAQRADVRKERQILIENLTQQASQLRLQSTLMGASPKAVINGELVGEGSVVACGSGESRVTFRVLKIEARRIMIEREGIKLEIQMK
jgi:hypothetical protein